MDSTPKNHLKRPGETFDLNSVQLAGAIRKLWPRNGDVYARLRISTRDHLVEEDDAQAVYANLRFSQGQVKNQPVTLQPGDLVRVSGFLTHNEFFETIQRFLQVAHAEGFLEDVPADDHSAWQSITFRRTNIMINVRSLVFLQPDGKAAPGPQLIEEDEPPQDGKLNHVVLEGIVARQWQYAEHIFIRMAIYDRYTPLEHGGKTGNRGRPRRSPHYITVRFQDGKVADRPVTLRIKDRLRVTGSIGEQKAKVTLHQALVETGKSEVIDLLGRLPNADKTEEIHIQQESLHVDAQALVAYSTGRPESDHD